jgi:hypothetical protein
MGHQLKVFIIEPPLFQALFACPRAQIMGCGGSVIRLMDFGNLS